jgi:predicted nucleic acid-binding protein
MSVKVVDASAIAAVLLEESSADAIQARIAGQQLTAPTILGFEFCNVCVVKAQRYPEKRDIFREALEVFHSMAIWMQAINAAEVFILAERHTLSAYDCQLSVARVAAGRRIGHARCRIGPCLRRAGA